MATSLQDLDLDAVQRTFENYYLTSDTGGNGDFVQGNIFSRGQGYVQGSVFSRGKGLGSFIKSVIKVAKPLAKKVGTALAPMAKRTGQYMLERGTDVAIDTATDVLKGDSFNTALSRNAEMGMDNARYDAARMLQGMKRKQPAHYIQSVKKKSPKGKTKK